MLSRWKVEVPNEKFQDVYTFVMNNGGHMNIQGNTLSLIADKSHFSSIQQGILNIIRSNKPVEQEQESQSEESSDQWSEA